MTTDDIYTNPPTEVIRGQIIAKSNNYIAARGRLIKSKSVREYEQEFARQCVKYAGQRIDTPFELVAVIYYKSRVYDIDNSLKTLLDCLQYVEAITNDNLCTRIVADKLVDPRNPRVEFTLLVERPQPTIFD